MTNQDINFCIAKIRELESQADQIKKEVDSLRDELKHELDLRCQDSIDTGLHRVFYNCYEKSGVDTDKLKLSGLYAEYSKKSIITQFKITDVKVV